MSHRKRTAGSKKGQQAACVSFGPITVLAHTHTSHEKRRRTWAILNGSFLAFVAGIISFLLLL